jgi:integrase
MAIKKIDRKSGRRYQVKIRGSDGMWITKVFSARSEAEKYESKLKTRKFEGETVSSGSSQMTVDQYFSVWFEQARHTASPGWRREQSKRYENHVKPIIGAKKLNILTPAMILEVINSVRKRGFTERTALHMYAFLHKLFGDAVELFRCLDKSPVVKSLRPKPPEKESRHLTKDQAIKLLSHVEGKSYELAIWIGVFLGLRAGEIQALIWDNVNLVDGIVHVRAAFIRKEGVIRDYPKGKKWHSHKIPPELLEKLRHAKVISTSHFVVTSPRHEMLNYWGLRMAIKRYCAEVGVPDVVAHGLRHSTAAIYMAHGASRDDLRKLFRHSSSTVTDLYIHDTCENVDSVAKVIRLFPAREKSQVEENLTEAPCYTKCSTPVENAIPKIG